MKNIKLRTLIIYVVMAMVAPSLNGQEVILSIAENKDNVSILELRRSIQGFFKALPPADQSSLESIRFTSVGKTGDLSKRSEIIIDSKVDIDVASLISHVVMANQGLSLKPEPKR